MSRVVGLIASAFAVEVVEDAPSSDSIAVINKMKRDDS
jgi:hypothetical protein